MSARKTSRSLALHLSLSLPLIANAQHVRERTSDVKSFLAPNPVAAGPAVGEPGAIDEASYDDVKNYYAKVYVYDGTNSGKPRAGIHRSRCFRCAHTC